MLFETKNFLVVDDRRLLSKRKYKYTSGVLMPIGEDIPVIVKGKGCVGVTKVESVYIDETGTTVTFGSVAEIGDTEAKAYYNLYRSNVTVSKRSSSNDMDDDYEDQHIPGMFRPRNTDARWR